MSSSVAIIGGGAWGVALAIAAKRAGTSVTLCTRRSEHASREDFAITSDFDVAARSRLVVIAVPSSVVREVLRELGDRLDGSHLVVHGIRGLERVHLETVSDVVREETPARRLGALGGPVQADELTKGRPSAIVCGSRYPEVIDAVTRAFQSPSLKVFGTPDLRGLEWASALVGCLAIGVGFAKEAGAGPGLLAALISRGVDEAARIAAAAGAEERTMLGLGGYGDLLASIALDDRPEVAVGRALARGSSIADALTAAKLRVEAVPLIPRVLAFAKERKAPHATFEALEAALSGAASQKILEMLFSA